MLLQDFGGIIFRIIQHKLQQLLQRLPKFGARCVSESDQIPAVDGEFPYGNALLALHDLLVLLLQQIETAQTDIQILKILSEDVRVLDQVRFYFRKGFIQ